MPTAAPPQQHAPAPPSVPRPASRLGAVLGHVPVGVTVALVPVMAVAGLAQQIGWWTPWVAVASLLGGIALALAVARRLPLPPLPPLPGWAAAAVAVIGAGSAVWSGLTHGEHVAVRRDPGAYATYALGLARFGGVPIDPRLEAFGLNPADPLVRVSSGANYQVPVVTNGQVTALEVSPQFFVGAPSVLSLGWWSGGWDGLFLVMPIAGGLALVAFGVLAAALSGPRVAVLATLALALTQPILMTNRQTFSEPLALLYLCSGALVLVAALKAADDRARLRLGVLAGGIVAATLFIRVDALREMVLLIPVIALASLLRHRAGLGLAIGLLAVGVPAMIAATPWSSPYVRQVGQSLVPLLWGGLALLVASVAVVAVGRYLQRRPSLPGPLRAALSYLPGVAAGLVAATLVLLILRPLGTIVRADGESIPGRNAFVGALQAQQGLTDDPSRTYAENSVEWMAWYLGPVAVGIAFAAAVVLVALAVRRLLRGELPVWVPVLAVGLAATALTLYRPGITPDHPWADRRYYTTGLPTLVLLASVAAVWLTDLAGRRHRVAGGLTAALAAGVLLVPALLATLPVATARTEVGQPAAAEQVCDALPDEAAVITLDHTSRVEWTPVIRAVCDVPIVGIAGGSGQEAEVAARIADAATSARASGYIPVALAGTQAGRALTDPLGVTWQPLVQLETTEPQRLLEERPHDVRPLPMSLSLAAL